MKEYIGIDPGKKGAVAKMFESLYEDGGVEVVDLPLNEQNEVDTKKLISIFNIIFCASKHSSFCLIEKAQPMPKQGVKSVFNYGFDYGKIIAVVESLEIPYQLITSNIWKKEFSLIHKDKKASAEVAKRIFPKENFYTERGRLFDGRAEALLIAEYARRKNM